ncbi:response regulator transcription factor [Herbiconiux sp. 11R-BC]|uniref:response regulator transcription factor n=1 Tax=Herbiconiux sp. 11R-BC TaxID=3111637 RepID=UPI003C127F9D
MGDSAESRAIRIAVVDDHEAIRVGVRQAFAGDPAIDVVTDAATVDEMLATASEAPAASDGAGAEALDVVMLDLRLRDGSSPARNAERVREATGAVVVAYTSGEHPYLIRLAARSGITALVRKSEPVAALREALLAAAAGQAVMSADLAAAIHSDPEITDARLSPQEQRVLELFADGLKTQVVASELGIATGTVEDYVRRIRSKYSSSGRPAHTKIDLYKRALEDGLLPVPGADL